MSARVHVVNWTSEQVERFAHRLREMGDTQVFCLLLDLQAVLSESEWRPT